jgi:hypothetical protein
MVPAATFRVPETVTPTHGAVLGNDMMQFDAEMVELALLLPRWQAVALETAAKQRGLGAGQLLRRMIAAAVSPQIAAGPC